MLIKKNKLITSTVFFLISVVSISFIFSNNSFATEYIHNYNSLTGTGWSGSVIWAEPFTGLFSSESIHNLKLNVTSVGGTSHIRAKIFTDNSTLTTLTIFHNYHATDNSGLNGFIFAQKFTGLPPGKNITSLNFNVGTPNVGGEFRAKVYDNTGVSQHLDSLSKSRQLFVLNTGMNNAVHVVKFTGLTPGRPILSMGINIITTGGGAGDLRYKVYDDNGTGPNNLLGETGSNFESSSGFYTFSFPSGTVVPVSGTIWAGFETDNANMQIQSSADSGSYKKIAHTFGAGPNPFGSPISNSNPFQITVTYSAYDISGAPGNLLGEGFNANPVNTGLNNNVNFNATIPSNGIVYAGFELLNSVILVFGNTTTGEYQIPHTFGAGPSFAFANMTNSTLAHGIQITYIGQKGPDTLLGQTGSILINSTGLNIFPFSGITVPSNGRVWAGFETDQVNLGLKLSSNLPLNSTGVGVHTYGTGPSSFPIQSPQTFGPYMSLNVDSPSITVTPALGIVGNTATLSGVAMGANNNLSFTFAGSPLTTNPTTVTTNSTGGFSGVTFTIPATSNGVKTINATNNAGISATASYSVNPSSFSSSPTSGNVGTSESFTGTGFSELDTITIKFDGSTVDTLTSDSIGNISGLFIIPSSVNGTHTITATDTHGNNKTSSFITTPSISISPTSGSSGNTITISGNGFNSTSTISIYFDNVLQTTSPATVTTNSTGSFSGVTFSVPVSPVNTYIIKVRDSATNQATQNFSIFNNIPDAPTLSALALSPTSIRLTSIAGASSGDHPVTWFGVICQKNGGSWNTIVSNSTLPSPRIYEITGLQPSDTLICEWRDGSASGWSAWSNQASVSTTLPLVQAPMTNNHLTSFIKWLSDHGGIYFGFTLGPFIPMLIGLMATPKTVGIFAVITLAIMGIVHASGLYVYPNWYWGLMLLFGVVLVLSRANEK